MATIKSKEALKEKHSKYTTKITEWMFWDLCYNGGDALIEGVMKRHERESLKNFKQRKEEAMAFNYCTLVVDLFNFYLTEKEAIRELGTLADDKSWKLFVDDCDLYGTNFNIFMNETQKLSSIHGAVGVLIDKPRTNDKQTKQQEVDEKIYPYCATFTLPNILDWGHERNPQTGRPMLVYLKLMDIDGKYVIWELDTWELWEIPIDKNGTEGDPVLEDSGPNPLGEIPFTWMLNIRNANEPYIGSSDIKDSARIIASIIRNVSYGEEVIKWAAFPMLLEADMGDDEEGEESIVGPRAVKTFDAENKNSKPSWLEAAVQEPISSIMEWIAMKVEAVFDMAHISGIHMTAKSKEARSGTSLRYEFNQLASVLSKKSDNLTEAELQIIRFWTKWQNNKEAGEGISVKRSKEFSIDDLSDELENLSISMKKVLSSKFQNLAMNHIVKKIRVDMTDSEREEIFNEIKENVEAQFDVAKHWEQSYMQSGVNFMGGS